MARYFVLLCLCLLAAATTAGASDTKLSFKGGFLDTSLPDDLKSPSRDELLQWIRDAADAVIAYYGRFPVDHARLEIRKGARAGVHHGVTYPRGGGFIIISVGEGTTATQLHEDWTRTHNGRGLQDALRAILNHDGTIANDWPIENALKVGDKATGTTVLADLYRTMKDKPSRMDLENLWKKLGVSVQDGNVKFDDHAPEANIRKAITEKR